MSLIHWGVSSGLRELFGSLFMCSPPFFAVSVTAIPVSTGMLLLYPLKPLKLYRFCAGDHYAKGKSISMTVQALMDLRKRVDEILHRRRAELEKQLERIGVVGGARVVRGGGSVLKGKKIPPKYRSPLGETWAGRGAKPRWLVAAIQRGKMLNDFLIEKSARKGGRKRRSKR